MRALQKGNGESGGGNEGCENLSEKAAIRTCALTYHKGMMEIVSKLGPYIHSWLLISEYSTANLGCRSFARQEPGQFQAASKISFHV